MQEKTAADNDLANIQTRVYNLENELRTLDGANTVDGSIAKAKNTLYGKDDDSENNYVNTTGATNLYNVWKEAETALGASESNYKAAYTTELKTWLKAQCALTDGTVKYADLDIEASVVDKAAAIDALSLETFLTS